MAGLFGLFDFTKEGRGVSKDDPPLKGVLLFFSIFVLNFWKLMLLNLLFLLFCIPIVSIPAALSGMMCVLRNMVDEKLVFVWRDFWVGLKGNFVQSLLYGILIAVVGVLVYIDVFILFANRGNLLIFISGGLIVFVCFVFSLMNYYVPLMIISVKLRLLDILNNAFRLTFIAFLRNLLIFSILSILTAAMILFFPATIILVVLLYFSTTGLIICFSSWPILKKYVITETS